MGTIILLFYIVLLAFLTLRRPIYGITLYCGIRMTIPIAARFFGFSFNTICLAIFTILSWTQIRKFLLTDKCSRERKFINVVTQLYVYLFFLTVVSFCIPLSYQWSKLFQDYFTMIVPAIYLAIFLRTIDDLKVFGNSVLCFAGIAALYGVYTFVIGANPLMDIFNTTGIENYGFDDTGMDQGVTRLGLFGIASGIFGKGVLSFYLIPFLMYAFYCDSVNIYLRAITVVLMIVAIALNDSRTNLLAIFVFLFLLYFNKDIISFKSFVLIFVMFCSVIYFASRIEELKNLLEVALFVFDDSHNEELGVGGSSVSLRLFQLNNCVDDLMTANILQGKGFGYTTYYYKEIYKNGLDERFLGFESEIFHILMGSGVIGLVLWIKTYYQSFRILYGRSFKRFHLAFFLTYVIVLVMSANAGSLWVFFIIAVASSKQHWLSISNNQIIK